MPNLHKNPPPESNDPFEALFSEAESSEKFWISKAKFNFTEEMLSQMEVLGFNKTDLATCLNVKPAQITRLCSGQNNFTLETMVRIARALRCEFRCQVGGAGRGG